MWEWEPDDIELGWEPAEVPVNYWGETTEEDEDLDYDSQ